MNTRRMPVPLQFAVLLALLCLALLAGMWGASQLALPLVARIFNVLFLIAVFVGLFFLVTTAIVMLVQLTRKLLDLYTSR